MRKICSRGLAAAVGLTAATALGLTAVSAASPSPGATVSPTSGSTSAGGGSPSPAHHPALRWLRRHSAAGEVVSDSSSGGTLSHGQLVIKEPNGTQLTLSLASKTKAWKYQGHGAKPIAESASGLPAGEVVVVLGRNYQGQAVVGRIIDLGFRASG